MNITFTNEQEAIINLKVGKHVVLAPPGAGKTTILQQRIIQSLKNGTPSNEMVCLTFTNRAAKRMSADIKVDGVFIGNIHSFCNFYLRKFYLIPATATLLDEDDASQLIAEVVKNNKCHVYDGFTKGYRQIKPSEILNINLDKKISTLNPEHDLKLENKLSFYCDEDKQNSNKICDQYEFIKSKSYFLDYNDLLVKTYGHSKKSNSPEKFIKWLQVDEAQDLNSLQWAIINNLTPSTHFHQVYFGDLEQAIFSFMGARPDILRAIACKYETHYLYENFRSPQKLLDVYNKYARILLKPIWQKDPYAHRRNNHSASEENKLLYKQFDTVSDERKWILDRCARANSNSTNAILVPTNKIADYFADYARGQNIKVLKISGNDLFRRRYTKDILSVLRVISDQFDKIAWIRILHLFGDIELAKESRDIVNELFSVGFNPLDFINNGQNIPSLDIFQSLITNGRVVVFDTETTGLDISNDDIIQIAAVEIVCGKIGRTLNVFIDTEKDLSESQKIHKITKKYLLENSISKRLAFQRFLSFVGNSPVIAHNAEFDFSILKSNIKRTTARTNQLSLKVYDSAQISKKLYPTLNSYKLKYLLESLHIKGDNSHNALDDAIATANLSLQLAGRLQEISAKREQTLANNTEKLSTFDNKFSVLYNALEGNFSKDLSLDCVTNMIIFYMTDHLQYYMSCEDISEIGKLVSHMNSCATFDNSLATIRKHIPDYEKFKESDLVTDRDKIVITTVHKAKGLDFDNVYIPCCTDNNYPNYYSKNIGESRIIEDARVLYVAMTRAKKSVTITSCKSYNRYNQIPSRFLGAIKDHFSIE